MLKLNTIAFNCCQSPAVSPEYFPADRERVESYTQHLQDIIQQAFQNSTICSTDSKQDSGHDKAQDLTHLS
jgi:hypothetical protein